MMNLINKRISYRESFLSIIVASYNYEQYIGLTLNSLISKTYQNFEIIVVDDGSKDSSIQIISEYVNRYNNIKLYQHANNSNKGLIASILLGIAKAKGQYIAFCESDDYWTSDYLEKKVQVINQYDNVNIISNDIELIGDNDCIKQRKEYIQTISLLLKNGYYKRLYDMQQL